jgi:hypothetical protein
MRDPAEKRTPQAPGFGGRLDRRIGSRAVGLGVRIDAPKLRAQERATLVPGVKKIKSSMECQLSKPVLQPVLAGAMSVASNPAVRQAAHPASVQENQS